MEFEIGKSYTADIQAKGETYKIHVLSIVDKDMVVFKFYGKQKQRWHYDVRRKCDLAVRVAWANETKHLTKTK